MCRLVGGRVALFLCLALLVPVGWLMPAPGGPVIEWAGEGHFRLLLKVDPYDTNGRDRDEGVAEAIINWPKLLAGHGDALKERTPDLGSLQVIRYDPSTGKALRYGSYAYARGPCDRPFRWY